MPISLRRSIQGNIWLEQLGCVGGAFAPYVAPLIWMRYPTYLHRRLRLSPYAG